MGNTCKDCENFIPIEGTTYGKCKIKPFAQKQGGRLTDKEFITHRGKEACKKGFIKNDNPPPIIKACKRCGEKFVVPAGSRRMFCCEECRKIWYREEMKQLTAEKKAWKKPKKPTAKPKEARKPKKPKLTIGEICRLAMAEHLSYGQYVEKYGV